MLWDDRSLAVQTKMNVCSEQLQCPCGLEGLEQGVAVCYAEQPEVKASSLKFRQSLRRTQRKNIASGEEKARKASS
jgi:hypothetical protein